MTRTIEVTAYRDIDGGPETRMTYECIGTVAEALGHALNDLGLAMNNAWWAKKFVVKVDGHVFATAHRSQRAPMPIPTT